MACGADRHQASARGGTPVPGRKSSRATTHARPADLQHAPFIGSRMSGALAAAQGLTRGGAAGSACTYELAESMYPPPSAAALSRAAHPAAPAMPPACASSACHSRPSAAPAPTRPGPRKHPHPGLPCMQSNYCWQCPPLHEALNVSTARSLATPKHVSLLESITRTARCTAGTDSLPRRLRQRTTRSAHARLMPWHRNMPPAHARHVLCACALPGWSLHALRQWSTPAAAPGSAAAGPRWAWSRP